jgi:type II secretory pathway component GspD/PulD (secretin)
MTATPQPRASAIARRAITFALCGLSVATLAQAPANKKATEASDPPTKRQTQAAEEAYLAGARLLDRNDLAGAEVQFDKAVKLNPDNGDYAKAYAITHQRHVTELVQQAGKARLLGQNDKAETLLAEARLLDPQNNIVGQGPDPGALPKLFHPKIEPWIREGPSVAGPITLLPNPGLKSFHLHADEQDVIRQVLSSYGIAASFDESVQRQNLRFDLEDSPYQQAVPILLGMAHLFAVPLDAKSVLIAKDTPENRQKFEHQLQETIYIPGMTNEQMDEFGNVVRNVFDVKQLTVDKSAGTLVIRAPEETLSYVNLTLADLIDGGSEVMIELKLYSVDKTNQRNIGAQLPQQIGLYNVNAAAANLVNANQSLVNQAIAQGLIPAGSSNITIALALIASGLVQSTLLSNTIGFFGGGITATGVTINQNPTFTLALNASDTHALNDMQIRVGDRQAATFRIGERYPITTATYSTASPAQTSALNGISVNGVSAASLLNAAVGSPITIPQIQFEDLGLTLKATPIVQRSGDIKMHLDLKIEALNGGAVNNIPILNSQQFASDVTVADGDTAVMVSSITKSESASLSGYPGLADLPGFQTATADKVTMTNSSELILLVTPHVTRRRTNVSAGPRIAINLPQPSN